MPLIDQQPAEDVENPVKAVDKADAGADEDAAHDQRAEHSPEEHAVLHALGNAK